MTLPNPVLRLSKGRNLLKEVVAIVLSMFFNYCYVCTSMIPTGSAFMMPYPPTPPTALSTTSTTTTTTGSSGPWVVTSTTSSSSCQSGRSSCSTARFLSSTPGESNDDDDSKTDAEGANLAAELFKMASSKGIGIDENDLLDEDEDDDDDDEDDDDDDEEVNIPQGAINAFLGYDTGDVGEKLSGNVSLTDDQLYSEVKERVLDTAGGFVDFVKGAQSEEDEQIGTWARPPGNLSGFI